MTEWKIKTIEEMALEIYSGNEITKVQLDTGNYPSIKYSDLFDHDVQINECK